jgi:hypothetical protein
MTSLNMDQKQAWEWYERVGVLKGFNFLPSTAVNSTEMWQAESFDPATIERELGWAAQAGYNSARVFLQYIVWRADPQGFRQRFAQFLDIAARHGISCMPILFDDCAFDGRDPYLGRQDDPVPGVHNSRWTPSPGLKLVTDRAAWPGLEQYVLDLVGCFGRDERVVVWDLYNEPGNSGMGESSLPLAEAAFDWARAAQPAQPLTIGVWADFNSAMSQRLAKLSDVVSFHAYDRPEGVQTKIEWCRQFGRPLLCTEWLHRQTGNRFDNILPLFAAHQVGWYHWGLVAGRTQTYLHWGSKPGDPVPDEWQHDIFHTDGRSYDEREIMLVREFLFDQSL